MSGRLVAATTTMPAVRGEAVHLDEQLVERLLALLVAERVAAAARPTASSSSMKMMHEGCFAASLNSRRTRDAPTPAYISTKSEPLAKRNGTPASPAIDRASSVLPVPGGPTSSTPFGMRPPSAEKRPGSRRKSTISLTSSFASSTPATSAKVTTTSCVEVACARLSRVGTLPAVTR